MRRRYLAVSALAVLLVLTECKPATNPRESSRPAPAPVVPNTPKPQPTNNPNGGKTDPNPQAYAEIPINAECAWSGRRWITMLVIVDDKPLSGHPRELGYEDDGETSRDQNFTAKPGAQVTLDCAPMPDMTRAGAIQCTLRSFNRILQPDGYRRQQEGSSHCYARLPMRA